MFIVVAPLKHKFAFASQYNLSLKNYRLFSDCFCCHCCHNRLGYCFLCVFGIFLSLVRSFFLLQNTKYHFNRKQFIICVFCWTYFWVCECESWIFSSIKYSLSLKLMPGSDAVSQYFISRSGRCSQDDIIDSCNFTYGWLALLQTIYHLLNAMDSKATPTLHHEWMAEAEKERERFRRNAYFCLLKDT